MALLQYVLNSGPIAVGVALENQSERLAQLARKFLLDFTDLLRRRIWRGTRRSVTENLGLFAFVCGGADHRHRLLHLPNLSHQC